MNFKKIKNKKQRSRDGKIIRTSLWTLLIILIIFIIMFLWVRVETYNDPRLNYYYDTSRNLNNLRAYAEMYYESHNYSYLNWCSDESFTSVRDELNKNRRIYIDCLDSDTKYVMFAPLERERFIDKFVIFKSKKDSQLSNYRCIDSTGFFEITPKPTGESVSCLPPQD